MVLTFDYGFAFPVDVLSLLCSDGTKGIAHHEEKILRLICEEGNVFVDPLMDSVGQFHPQPVRKFADEFYCVVNVPTFQE